MDIATVYESIKGNRENGFFNITGGNCDINMRDAEGESLLHYAVQKNDLETTKFLLKEGIIYNYKNSQGKTPEDMANVGEIKNVLQTCTSFFKHVKAGNLNEVSKHVEEYKFLVNIREQGAFTPLHYAAFDSNENMSRLLLENGGKAIQFTKKGETPLHIAVSRKAVGVAKLLLKSIKKSSDLLRLVNAQTKEMKNTCLHNAAENGCLETIKLLLKNGAIYEIANELNRIPFDLCKENKARKFLKAIDKFFIYAKDGDPRLMDELSEMDISEFEVVTNACNSVYHTLIQELIFFNHKNAAQKLIEIKQLNNKTEKRQWEVKELKELKNCAEKYLSFSDTYMNMLKGCSHPNESDINCAQWKMLKEGSYLLGNADNLVNLHRSSKYGVIDNQCLLIVEATLKKLQFNPNHISYAVIPQSSIFASKAEGHEYYYKLLHSKLNSDVRHFIKIVENFLDKPIQEFLAYANREVETLISLSSRLMDCVKQGKYIGVRECIRQGADVNFLNDREEFPLQQAIQNIDTKIVKILLEGGADIEKNLSSLNSNTLLHLAATLDPSLSEQEDATVVIIKYLLQHGATYNAINNNGETAENVSKFQNTKTFLKDIDTCFKYAEDDNSDLLSKLQNMEIDDFKAATQSHSVEGHTLFQKAITVKHKRIEDVLLKFLQGHRTRDENA